MRHPIGPLLGREAAVADACGTRGRRAPALPLVLALALALAAGTFAGCFGCRNDASWTLLVTVDRGALPVPDRVTFAVTHLVSPGGATLTSETREVDGADFFAAEGTSNVLQVTPMADAGALRVRADALDAAGALLGSGVVEAARFPGTAMVTLFLDAGGETDGSVASDAGASDSGGTDAGAGTDSGPPPACGDGACGGAETCASCEADCGACPPACPDASCDPTESCSTCPADCGACPIVCGDGSCAAGENCATCTADCGVCPPSCPNGTCGFGETCSSCPMDCGPCCGNGSCEPLLGESCAVCALDCGVCPTNCSNALDDDGDALTDWPNDPGCTELADDDETDPPVVPACFDGIDNDGDALVDYPADPGCEDAADGGELDLCVPGLEIQVLPPAGNVTGTTSGTSLLEASCNSGFTTSGPEAVWRVDVPGLATVTFSTAQPGTTLASSLSVRTDCGAVASELACVATPPLGEVLTLPDLVPGSYFVLVDGQDMGAGPYELSVSGAIAAGQPCDPSWARFACQLTTLCAPGPGPTGMACTLADCADGTDNDGDVLADFPFDPGCAALEDPSETDACPAGAGCPACGNGVDDDADLTIDYPADSGCGAASDDDEAGCTFDFAGGSAMGWTFSNTCTSGVGWIVDDFRAVSPSHSLYYGNPATRNFDCSGLASGGTATSSFISLPAAGSSVSFWVWIATEGGTFYDQLGLDVVPSVGPALEVWDRNDFSAGAAGNTSGLFVMQTVDLSAYDGQTIQLRWSFESVDGVANGTEGVYVDDIFVSGACP